MTITERTVRVEPTGTTVRITWPDNTTTVAESHSAALSEIRGQDRAATLSGQPTVTRILWR